MQYPSPLSAFLAAFIAIPIAALATTASAGIFREWSEDAIEDIASTVTQTNVRVDQIRDALRDLELTEFADFTTAFDILVLLSEEKTRLFGTDAVLMGVATAEGTTEHLRDVHAEYLAFVGSD